jgi:hypothetical protein
MLRLLAPLPLVRGLLVLLALAVGLAGMAAVHSVDLAGSTEVVASVENADLLGHSYHHNHDGEPSAPLHNPFDHTHVTLGLPAPPPSILPPASSRIAWLRADPAARSEPRQLDRPPRRSFVA